MVRLNRPSAMLLTALILGWIWNLLFFDNALGVSVPLFVLLLLAALFGWGSIEGVRPRWRNLWLLLPLLFFAIMVCVRASPSLTELNLTACLLLAGLVVHFFRTGTLHSLGLIGYPIVLFRTGIDALVQPAPLVSASIDRDALQQHGTRNMAAVARGSLLALPVLALFAVFFASADLVFASYMDDFLQFDLLSEIVEWVWRGILIAGVAWLIAGSLSRALDRSSANSVEPILKMAHSRLRQISSLGFIEVTTLLTAVDLLFLLFVWIQFTYLFGGKANIALEGYTYAEYARRGFFELIVVSILALGLIVGMRQWTRRDTVQHKAIFAALASLMILSVLVMLASAFQRLLLYKDAYGYSQLRLYSHIFMIWLGFACLWFLAVLWLQSDHLAFGPLLAALGFLITLNIVNPDAYIAQQNLSRLKSGAELDLTYLTTLSEDVVPVLVDALDQLPPTDRQALDHHLRQRLEQMAQDNLWRAWPAFHLARQRAYDLMVDHQTRSQ